MAVFDRSSFAQRERGQPRKVDWNDGFGAGYQAATDRYISLKQPRPFAANDNKPRLAEPSMATQTILDEVESAIKANCFFDRDEKYVIATLWPVATDFVKHEAIRIFDAFPYLAFMSPEPASGKSRALKVIAALACNGLYGTFTPASLMDELDQAAKTGRVITPCLDEIDETLAPGKEVSHLIQLLNLGYERGAVVRRMSRFKDGQKKTPAYCPKAFAGLKIAKIPPATMSRTIKVNMRPKSQAENVEDHIDFEVLAKLREKIAALSDDQDFIERLKEFRSEEGFLSNRDQQIFAPLLAIAKATSEAWYQRARKAAEYFTKGKTEKNLSRTILLGVYRVFRSGKYPDAIHSHSLVDELHQLGIPTYIDKRKLSKILSDYDEDTKTKQIKINGENLNGYEWHTFEPTFEAYISAEEIAEIEQELGQITSTCSTPSTPATSETLQPLW